MTAQTRGLLFNLGRAGFSAILLIWVLSTAGLDQLAEAARGADLRCYALAVGLAVNGILLRSARWHALLKAVGARVSFGRAVYLYFVGAFFNTFLPTGFGGDVVRVFNARGSHLCKASVSPRARAGVVNGLGIWWRKLGLGGTNVNELTSQKLTDMGRAPVFYDCLVEVACA